MKSTITRRQLLKTSALGATGALIAACGGTRTVEVTKEVVKEVQVTAAPVQGEKTLLVWGSGLGLPDYLKGDPKAYGFAALEAQDKAFKAKNPDVKLVWEEHGWDEALRQNIVTALLAGTPPDVIVGENFFQQYASLKALIPLDEVTPAAVADESVLGTHKAAIFEGKNYGFSWLSGCFGFEANPNVLKQAGQKEEIPATWDDLLIAAEAVTKAGAGNFYGYTLQGPLGFSVGGMFRVAVYMQQSGVLLTKPDDPFYPNFNDPKSVPVWEFVRKLMPFTPPGLAFEADEGKVYTQLFQGKSAMQIAGSWHTSWAKQTGLENAIYGQVPYPKDGKPASYVVGNVIWGVMSATKVPDIGADWVMVSQSDEVQQTIFPGVGRIPPTKRWIAKMLEDTTVPEADKTYAKMLRDADLGILPQWIKEPNKLNSTWNDLFAAVITTETDIKQLADEAQSKAEEILKAAG
jgi:ABC-type glycerol-3-phosphate transport system substrate-binding protein